MKYLFKMMFSYSRWNESTSREESHDPGALHELKQACTSKYAREIQTH